MAYSGTSVEADINWIRLRIGDTDSVDVQLTDDEITTLLNTSPSVVGGAAACARAIAAKYARFGSMKEAEIYMVLSGEILSEVAPSYL